MSLQQQIEALLFASDEPLSRQRLTSLLGGEVDTSDIREALTNLEIAYANRGIRLCRVANGWQFRSAAEYSDIISQLWQTRPPKLSRALLETLAIIAYRQPTTRSEIEALRGTKVSSNIIATLMERGWIKTLGRKNVPGRPHLFGTGKQFLVDFGLNNLRDLPDASQLMDDDTIQSLSHLAEKTSQQQLPHKDISNDNEPS